jgi:hypothetical protein
LRTVFDQQQAASTADVGEWFEIGARAKQMSHQERTRPRADEPLEEVGARRQHVGIDVHRQRAEVVCFQDTNHVRVRDRRDCDLVAGLEGQSFEREIERRTNREAGEAALAARPRIERALLRSRIRRSKAGAKREQEVGDRDIGEEPRPKMSRRGVSRALELGLEGQDRIPQSACRFEGGEPRVGWEVFERYRLSELDPPAAKRSQPLGPDDCGGYERNAGTECDARWARVGPCSVLLP